MPSGAPLISAVICTRNRAGFLRSAVESLAFQTLTSDKYEVIVVDNASRDATRSSVQDLQSCCPNLIYVLEERVGLSRARNTGAEAARAPYIAFLDDDARAEPNWLESLVQAFTEVRPAPAAVGGPVWPDWGGPPPTWLPERHCTVYSCLDYGTQAHLLASDQYLVGANLAVKRDLLLEMGGFDTSLGRQGATLLSGEEAALLSRLRAHGLPIYYTPKAAVWHVVPKGRQTKIWFWSRMFWDGASQPLLDYGLEQTRSFYLERSYRDLRRIGFFIVNWSRFSIDGECSNSWDSAVALIKGMGRLWTDLLLTAGYLRMPPGKELTRYFQTVSTGPRQRRVE